jgi:CubicO group peptidase (beta-lactamase class C family)
MGGLVAATARSQLARAVLWRESDVDDYRRFPARRIAAGPDRFGFQRSAAGNQVPPAPVRRISVWDGARQLQWDLERFLAASQTTAFLIARGDTLVYEGYFNGYHRQSTQTSMSVAKSVLGLLVGNAVGEGRIGSADDPITRYVPELAARDRRFDKVTLRHLLTMTSGLRYEEGGGPWSDDTATYYAPDLRKLALDGTEVVEAPGRRFHYNNFNPLLVGLALEWATGMPVATWLEQRLWQPLGMEADGSWSLDSRHSSFEKMESGLNARAVDFAKLGLLVARDGRFGGRQLLPRAWVQDLTLVPTGGGSVPSSGYRYGQHLYVVPDSDLVLVRLGRDAGYPHWPQLLSDLARQLDQATSGSKRSMVGGDRGRRR